MHLRKLTFIPSSFYILRIASNSKPATLPFSTTTIPFRACKLLFPVLSSKPICETHLCFPKPNGFASQATVHTPVYKEEEDSKTVNLKLLKGKLEELGIVIDEFAPGMHKDLLCPRCNGGDSREKSLSLYIKPNGKRASWNCFRDGCWWKGRIRPYTILDSNTTYVGPIHIKNIKKIRELTEESLDLEPLCDEILGYFSERLITKKTLQRNRVRQRSFGYQISIAFTYWQNGVLTNCKYRDAAKRFWKENNTEKIFYGLGDVKGADDIIIVEGEMDKLAMEEAGFLNCIGVPDRAPQTVSSASLPPKDRDQRYQYLWNCQEYWEKASRIILATDGDQPGKALAEEISRCVGKERCWTVNWPKKKEDEYFKDANEVLMFLGPAALRGVIENAELYPIRGNEMGALTRCKALNGLYKPIPDNKSAVSLHAKPPVPEKKTGQKGPQAQAEKGNEEDVNLRLNFKKHLLQEYGQNMSSTATEVGPTLNLPHGHLNDLPRDIKRVALQVLNLAEEVSIKSREMNLAFNLEEEAENDAMEAKKEAQNNCLDLAEKLKKSREFIKHLEEENLKLVKENNQLKLNVRVADELATNNINNYQKKIARELKTKFPGQNWSFVYDLDLSLEKADETAAEDEGIRNQRQRR